MSTVRTRKREERGKKICNTYYPPPPPAAQKVTLPQFEGRVMFPQPFVDCVKNGTYFRAVHGAVMLTMMITRTIDWSCSMTKIAYNLWTICYEFGGIFLRIKGFIKECASPVRVIK